MNTTGHPGDSISSRQTLLRRHGPFPRVLEPPNKQYGYADSYDRTHMFRKTSWHAKMCATFTNAAERLRLRCKVVHKKSLLHDCVLHRVCPLDIRRPSSHSVQGLQPNLAPIAVQPVPVEMTDVYNMKNVFSCSDFLSDLWQGGSDGNETLGGLSYPASDEGGSTQLGQEGSTDILHLLNQAEEADSNSRKLANLTASSSNKQESGTGAILAHLGNRTTTS